MLISLVLVGIVYVELTGLAIHREVPPWFIPFSVTFLVFCPGFMTAAIATKHRFKWLVYSLFIWCAGLFFLLPFYFPNESHDAIKTGVLTLGSQELLDWVLPYIPDLEENRSLLPTPKTRVVQAETTPEPVTELDLQDHEIALPFDGEGRRLGVPVVFDQKDRTLELYMMLDTGATYTTLSKETLAELGVEVDATNPVIELHTANGMREAALVLLDRVWLGDLPLEGVAIAVCDDCVTSDTHGLLGLNVANRYNMTIDADRKEVIFSRRKDLDRILDVRHFVRLSTQFSRGFGRRVEVTMTLKNLSNQDIQAAQARVSCDADRWILDIDPPSAYEERKTKLALPPHNPCDHYQFALHAAQW